MKVLVTGANGFIGKNLITRLLENKNVEIVKFVRTDDKSKLGSILKNVEVVFHLAGINRSKRSSEFAQGNVELTEYLCSAIKATRRSIKLVYTSSIQAELDNDYGRSKAATEEVLLNFEKETGNSVLIYRLPNVFGKWAKPNYNSAVATFCHNICRGLPIEIHNKNSMLRLVYIDDVIDTFLTVFGEQPKLEIREHEISLGDLVEQLYRFKSMSETNILEPVGVGLPRALYATYLSYLPKNFFTEKLLRHEDERGVFVEMLKTINSGQFSFFTAKPGITRGGHYHHTKNEKFLVISGEARFRFCNLITNERYELFTKGEDSEVINTVPGWSHDITNVGENELICMLWSSEIFDANNPDTYIFELKYDE